MGRPSRSGLRCCLRRGRGLCCLSLSGHHRHPGPRRTLGPSGWGTPPCSGLRGCFHRGRGFLCLPLSGHHRPRRTRLAARARPRSRGTTTKCLPSRQANTRLPREESAPPRFGGRAAQVGGRWWGKGDKSQREQPRGKQRRSPRKLQAQEMGAAQVGGNGRAREASQKPGPSREKWRPHWPQRPPPQNGQGQGVAATSLGKQSPLMSPDLTLKVWAPGGVLAHHLNFRSATPGGGVLPVTSFTMAQKVGLSTPLCLTSHSRTVSM